MSWCKDDAFVFCVATREFKETCVERRHHIDFRLLLAEFQWLVDVLVHGDDDGRQKTAQFRELLRGVLWSSHELRPDDAAVVFIKHPAFRLGDIIVFPDVFELFQKRGGEVLVE